MTNDEWLLIAPCAVGKSAHLPVQSALEAGFAVWHRRLMKADEIRVLLKATPFRPFTVYLAGEKSFQVPHMDFASLSPSGRTMIVFYHDKEAFEILDVPLIARIHVQEPTASGS